MGTIVATIHVEMEDGSEWDVSCDQRDVALWEMQTFYDDAREIVRQRFVSYAASSRQKLTDLSWPKFNAACVNTRYPDAGPTDEDVDPTRPGPSGEA